MKRPISEVDDDHDENEEKRRLLRKAQKKADKLARRAAKAQRKLERALAKAEGSEVKIKPESDDGDDHAATTITLHSIPVDEKKEPASISLHDFPKDKRRILEKFTARYLHKLELKPKRLKSQVEKGLTDGAMYLAAAKRYFVSTDNTIVRGAALEVLDDLELMRKARSLTESSHKINESVPQNEYEAAWRQYAAEPDAKYTFGHLTDTESQIVAEAVDRYCEEKGFQLEEFAEMLHEPRGSRSKHERLTMFANFIYLFPYRKANNVRSHLVRRYQPHIRGKFSPEEDAQILALVEEKGNDFVAISAMMGRYREDVRDRYRDNLVNRSSQGSWSPEEVQRLRAIMDAYPDDKLPPWQDIAIQIGTRTRRQVREKLTSLYPRLRPNPTAREERARMKRDLKEKSMSNEVTKDRTIALLPGDRIHILSLIKHSRLRSLEDIYKHNILEIYNDVFTKSQTRQYLASIPLDPTSLDRKVIKSEIHTLRNAGDLRRSIVDSD